MLYNDHEYENLWHDERTMAGFQVTVRNRDLILTELEESIRTNILKINSHRTLNELNTFVINTTGKITADRGKHDDLIMSLCLANHVLRSTRETSLVEFNRDSAFKEDNKYKLKNKIPLISQPLEQHQHFQIL